MASWSEAFPVKCCESRLAGIEVTVAWDWEEVRLLRVDLRLPVLELGDVSMAAATAGTSAPSISAAALPFRGKVECDGLSTDSGGGTAASGIFCLLDRRTEELGWGPVARFFSALETFRFRDSDGGGAVGDEDSGKGAVEAGGAAGARAAWLAAWRAEDLVILWAVVATGLAAADTAVEAAVGLAEGEGESEGEGVDVDVGEAAGSRTSWSVAVVCSAMPKLRHQEGKHELSRQRESRAEQKQGRSTR